MTQILIEYLPSYLHTMQSTVFDEGKGQTIENSGDWQSVVWAEDEIQENFDSMDNQVQKAATQYSKAYEKDESVSQRL